MLLILILVCIFLIYTFIPSNIYKQYFKRKKTLKEKNIYLTFDDGPSEYTEELLDLLKEYDVKASFFCVRRFCIKISKYY